MSNSRFHFLKDETLKKNLDTVFDEIIEVVVLSQQATQDTNLQIYYKYAINSTASIVEALLYYYLSDYYCIYELPSGEFKYSEVHVLYSADNLEVVGAVRSRKTKPIKNIPFEHIIKYYQKCEYLDMPVIRGLDNLRKQRNKMHIQGLLDIHRCSKKEVDEAFSIARVVVEFGEKLYLKNK